MEDADLLIGLRVSDPSLEMGVEMQRMDLNPLGLVLLALGDMMSTKDHKGSEEVRKVLTEWCLRYSSHHAHPSRCSGLCA